MRWSLNLLSPALVADGGAELALGPDAAGVAGRVKVSVRDGMLEFAAEAEGASESAPNHPEWHYRSHLAVLLNPGHDHATQWTYGVDDTGAVNARAQWTAPGEEPADAPSRKLDDPAPAEGRFEPLGGGRFRAVLRLPAGAVWPDGASVAGAVVKIGAAGEEVRQPLRWPDADWAGDAPLTFGDLYAEAPPLAVEQLEIPTPAWEEPATLVLRGSVAGEKAASGRLCAETILPGDGEQAQDDAPWRAERGRFAARVKVAFPHRAKWSNDVLLTARLRLTVTQDGGRVLWRGEYPFGFDAGIIVRERYGPCGRTLPERPEPHDPDFVRAFRRYVLARLPDYRPRTTRDGAPSDFYLADSEGKADLDLADPGWLGQVAEMLTDRFGRWDDALCAAAMWIYHPAITRHSSSWSRVSNRATMETLPRLGGCFCGDTARLGAAVAEQIGRLTGEALRAWSLGLRGHLCTLVATPAGRVVIDGMTGLWFHTLDNARLATLEEMRAERQIVERMWYCPRAHGHEFYYGVDTQIIRDWRGGALTYPG